jgi:hypothetical protein
MSKLKMFLRFVKSLFVSHPCVIYGDPLERDNPTATHLEYAPRVLRGHPRLATTVPCTAYLSSTVR